MDINYMGLLSTEDANRGYGTLVGMGGKRRVEFRRCCRINRGYAVALKRYLFVVSTDYSVAS